MYTIVREQWLLGLSITTHESVLVLPEKSREGIVLTRHNLGLGLDKRLGNTYLTYRRRHLKALNCSVQGIDLWVEAVESDCLTAPV